MNGFKSWLPSIPNSSKAIDGNSLFIYLKTDDAKISRVFIDYFIESVPVSEGKGVLIHWFEPNISGQTSTIEG